MLGIRHRRQRRRLGRWTGFYNLRRRGLLLRSLHTCVLRALAVFAGVARVDVLAFSAASTSSTSSIISPNDGIDVTIIVAGGTSSEGTVLATFTDSCFFSFFIEVVIFSSSVRSIDG